MRSQRRLAAVCLQIIFVSALANFSACDANGSSYENDADKAVRARATQLLDILRAEKWDEAVAFVSLDKVTKTRMAIPEGATREVIREKVRSWFAALYGSVKPGLVHSVHFHPRDSGLALVSYKHDDLDGFNMRLVSGRWLYTLDAEPLH
jgi:hypothetical protein